MRAAKTVEASEVDFLQDVWTATNGVVFSAYTSGCLANEASSTSPTEIQEAYSTAMAASSTVTFSDLAVSASPDA